MVMELFRSQPALCSFFLSVLEEWGARTLDWSLLRDEAFVDRFLRRLILSPEVDERDVYTAAVSLLQPSLGGLLVAPQLKAGGYFSQGELEEFVRFTLGGRPGVWDPAGWTELVTLLEELIFCQGSGRSELLLAMDNHGWVPSELSDSFRRRVRQTCRLSKAEKEMFFAGIASIPRKEDTAVLRLDTPNRMDLTLTRGRSRRGEGRLAESIV